MHYVLFISPVKFLCERMKGSKEYWESCDRLFCKACLVAFLLVMLDFTILHSFMVNEDTQIREHNTSHKK